MNELIEDILTRLGATQSEKLFAYTLPDSYSPKKKKSVQIDLFQYPSNDANYYCCRVWHYCRMTESKTCVVNDQKSARAAITLALAWIKSDMGQKEILRNMNDSCD